MSHILSALRHRSWGRDGAQLGVPPRLTTTRGCGLLPPIGWAVHDLASPLVRGGCRRKSRRWDRDRDSVQEVGRIDSLAQPSSDMGAYAPLRRQTDRQPEFHKTLF